uniref:Uncharacterized protein n=1 Tax=Tanacetum cinerariifolium TaxID=118510 RepID=A0A699IFH7_TANCI|nr:hypothetical protein [Tanacetum cinerariifolium]
MFLLTQTYHNLRCKHQTHPCYNVFKTNRTKSRLLPHPNAPLSAETLYTNQRTLGAVITKPNAPLVLLLTNKRTLWVAEQNQTHPWWWLGGDGDDGDDVGLVAEMRRWIGGDVAWLWGVRRRCGRCEDGGSGLMMKRMVVILWHRANDDGVVSVMRR